MFYTFHVSNWYWRNSILRSHVNNVRKQTKSENLFDFENRLELRWTRGSKLNKGIWLEIEATAAYFKREELCLLLLYGDDNCQIKDLLSEKVSFLCW